jgi:tellurite resistance protein
MISEKAKSYLETAHKTLQLALSAAKADGDTLAMEEIEMASNVIRGLY